MPLLTLDAGPKAPAAPSFERTVHLLAAGNRPAGRTIKTSAISR